MHASRATASVRLGSEARERAALPRPARAPDITLHSALRDSEARRGRDAECGVMLTGRRAPTTCNGPSLAHRGDGQLPGPAEKTAAASEAAVLAEPLPIELATP